MKAIGGVLAMALGVGAGVAVLAALSKHYLDAEAAEVARRFKLPPSRGSDVDAFDVIELIMPGAVERMKREAATTAIGGAAAAVLVYAVAREVIG